MIKKIYFIGIGGIGMSALARYFKAQKWAVLGSDATKSQITASLVKDGIKAKIGHKRAYLPANTALVVISQAVPEDNQELREARRQEVRVLTYPEAVAELTEQYETIAIAGAHGKSTTTALVAIILTRAGLDPTVIVGTNLKEFGRRNFRKGRPLSSAKPGDKKSYLVLEADEFGNAFSHYSPAIAAVTNIDREHLDMFKNLAGVKKAFIGFMENIASGGALIVNRDDKNLWSLRREVAAIETRKGVRVIWHSNRGTTAKKVRRVIQIPGEHNVANAVSAYKVGRVLGIPHKTILAAIGSYRGAWRRMEYRGKFEKALVYDDYAHHPTEIKATLKAFKQKYPNKKILCVFQPHQIKRLETLFKEFTHAFDNADETLILPIYKVTGRDTQRSRKGQPNKHDAQALARAIQKREPRKLLFYLVNPRGLKRAIRAVAAPLSRHVIVMMGAGDIVNLTDGLIK